MGDSLIPAKWKKSTWLLLPTCLYNDTLTADVFRQHDRSEQSRPENTEASVTRWQTYLKQTGTNVW